MINQLRAKVRLVKCPKCAKILPEPEQVPLYTCGGCETILQAKYFRREDRATEVGGSLEQIAVQSNADGEAPNGGESSSSSRRSSSADEQSTDLNRRRDKNVVEDSKPEAVESPSSFHHTSLLDKSLFLEGQGNGVVDNKAEKFDLTDHGMNEENQEQLAAASSSIKASLAKSEIVLENENSEQLSMENPTTEDVKRQEQFNGRIDDDANRKQIRDTDSAGGTSTLNEYQVLENKELFRNTELQLPVVNEMTERKEDQPEQSSDSAFGNQKQEKGVNSPIEASELNDSLANENKETLQSDSGDGMEYDGSDHNSSKETRKESLEGKGSRENILVNDSDYCTIKDTPEVVMLAKEDVNGKDQTDFGERIGNQPGKINIGENLLPVDITQAETDVSVEEIEAHSRAHGSVGASASNAADLRSNISLEPQNETSSVNKLTETSRQKIQDPHDCDVYEPEHVSFTHKPELLQPVDIQRIVDSSVKVVPISSSRGSLAYDGSVSSFDGNDDQVEQHPEEALPRNDEGAGDVGAEEIWEWSNAPSNRSYSTSRTQSNVKKSSIVVDEKLKSTKLEEEESVAENGIPGRNWFRPNRNRFPPRLPVNPSSDVAYDAGSSSGYIHDELSGYRMHHPPCRFVDSEPWHREMYSQRRNTDRRRFADASWSKDEFLPLYYNYETSGELYHRPRYYYDIDRRQRVESWSESGSLPPSMLFSGEVFSGTYPRRDPYMHHHTDDLRWSAQLPPPLPMVCSRERLFPPFSKEISWDPYDSYPTSPPQFLESETYPWAHDTISFSDDHRHTDQVMRRVYKREKRQAVKRHFWPMAGGAPFVTCYDCFNILQLPEDFLLSRRPTYRLRCGYCSKILEFSLENRSCLAPRMPNARSGASSFHGNSRGSSSITGEAQVQHTDGTESLSHLSLGASSREKNNLESRNPRNIDKMEGGSHNGANPSVQPRKLRVTWQLPDKNKSPLHQLMGYSSPHHLLNEIVSENPE